MIKTTVSKKLTSALEKPPTNERYLLWLYVSGVTEGSRRSILDINAVCQKPSLAMDEQIVATPTLIKMLSLPLRRIVGNLSDLDEETQPRWGVRCVRH